ncbi:MAG: SgcJ/EcaC family oxidoreductase [Bacteroidota bacterium]
MLEQFYCKSPEEIPETFAKAWNDRDSYAIANLFTEKAEFVNVVGLWWHDRESIWKAHDYGLKTIFSESKMEIRQIKSMKLGEDVTLVHARMILSGQTAHDGVNSPGRRQNILSFVAKHTDQGWVCVSAHNTDVIPGKETNIVDESGSMKSVDYRK